MEIYIGVIIKMDFIDSHCHIRCDGNFEENLTELKKIMKKNNIDKSVLFIDPFISKFECSKSSENCFHYCHVTDKLNKKNELAILCSKCNDILYSGTDPYNYYNKKLFDSINDSSFYLFLMLSISNITMDNTIQKFKYLYGNKIRGLKLYTGLSDLILNDVNLFDYDLPLLIHTGKADNQNPKNMINFLKKYKGYIILAHYARFSPEIVDLIKQSDNIYIDTSPASYIFNMYLIGEKKRGLFDYKNIYKPEDLYYKALDLYGVDKLVFGSDYPFSEMDDEIKIIKNLILTESEYNKITNGNIMKILRSK